MGTLQEHNIQLVLYKNTIYNRYFTRTQHTVGNLQEHNIQ